MLFRVAQPKPTIHLFAGPNGVGKTTFAYKILPKAGVDEFLNADLIAAGLSPLNPRASAIPAGRYLLRRWKELAASSTSFAFESTLSGRTYQRYLEQARQRGYVIVIHFLWVSSVSLCLRRINHRVKKGGHNVPETDVRRRYHSSLRNFFELYLPLASQAYLWDVTYTPPDLIATWQNSELAIKDEKRFRSIRAQAG